MQYFHKLTGLRGFAALIVFVSHAANETLLPTFLGNGFGQTGVMLFFLLSGFLMTQLYIHEEFSKVNIKRYAFARIGRVLPLYFTLLIISVLITKLEGGSSIYPFMFTEFNRTVEAFMLIKAPYIFWTIPVEVQFYVVFIGFWGLYKSGFSTYVLILYALLTVLPSAYFYFFVKPKLLGIISTYGFAFFLGLVSAFAFDKIKDSVSAHKAANWFGLPVLILLCLNLPELRSMVGLIYTEDFFWKTWGDPLTWLLVYSVFLCVILNSTSMSILNSQFFVYLGKVSYGFYLLHYPVLAYFVSITDINMYIRLGLALFITLLLSHLSFYFFEKPLANKIRRYGKSNAVSA
ncbi:acyltransferase family protein [Alteromonas oceani]|uniref:Acyltransferase family protein n=1 Tax=Alteromonas oceani TaxID=2071609 RepID=A0ABV7K6H1_9ALTE|nr:acyltransferase [Alteromonas oceani]